MSKRHECPAATLPEDLGGFFLEEDPAWLATSIEWSNKLHSGDHDEEQIKSGMLQAHQEFRALLPDTMSEETANLRAAGAVRGVLARILVHYYAMNLTPLVTGLLNGDTEPFTSAIDDPGFSVVKPRDAAIVTDPAFQRVWYGDDARLLAITGLLMERHIQGAVRRIPAGIRLGFHRAGHWVTRAEAAYANKRGIQADEADDGHFAIADPGQRGNWNERLLRHVISNHNKNAQNLNANRRHPEPFLTHNTETVTEHVTSYLLDVIHGFIPHQAKNPSSADWLQAILANLHGPSVASYMANMPNAEAEYGNRYVASESPGVGRYGSLREPLVVVKDEAGHIVTAT